MRIAHVVRQYLPAIGGMEEVVHNLARYQIEIAGHRPKIITLNRIFRNNDANLPAHETIEGIPVVRLSYSGSERYPLCPSVLGTLRHADVVHVHGIDFFFDFLALTRPWHRKPLLASTHGGFFHTQFAQRLKKLYFASVTRFSGRVYDRIVATSENDGTLFGGIVNPAKLTVIENGVDIKKYLDAASPQLKPVLIYFGRWSVNKGLFKAIDVLAGLRRRSPDVDWRMIIAGRAYDVDAAAIRTDARQKGVADSISLIERPSIEQLRAQIGLASYFICLSDHEGFGIAPIEAMSAGLRLVLSDIAPFRRLQNRAPSSVSIGGDVETWTMQILSAHACGQAAYEQTRRLSMQAADAYSWEDVGSRYVQQYEGMLAS